MSFSENKLPRLYRSVLRLTRGRGAFTLGYLNHRIFPCGQYVRLTSGDRFFLPPDPHFFGYLHGHEDHITDMIKRIIRPGDTCFDIGANIGYFTNQMAAISGNSGRVLAYEPDESNFRFLQENVELARAAGHNVEAVRAAVSDQTGQRRVVLGAESTLHTTVEADDQDPAAVTAVSVDDEMARLNVPGSVNLLKVDVEGHEPSVLRGMTKSVLAGIIRHAIIEVSPGSHAAEVESILDKWGEAVANLRLWRGGEWVPGRVTEIRARSDAVIDFR